jgi:hypothetical protein
MKTFVAVAATVAMSMTAQAGLFGHHMGCGASKCCDCAPTFQPECCRPTIVRPCHVNVYNYQRTCAKPMGCCDGSGPNAGCCPIGNGCAPAGNGCGPAGNACTAPCAPACGPAACAAPCGNACCNNAGCNGCAAPCGDACCDSGACCPCVDPCEIAELIYQSQTACYARQRVRALRILSRRYDCVCNPEIMSAFIYALNDADERVRAKAADAIGDQIRRNPCCCSQCVVSALTCALADCDRRVRRQAEQALRICGYDVVDGCCEAACDSCCNNACAPAGGMPAGSAAPTPAPAEEEAPAPAPAPPVESDRAYFPKRLPQQQTTARPGSVRDSLRDLFSLIN